MSWTANSYFVTVAILFLWRVQEIAEACSCSPAHPQQAFCNSDVGKCQRWVPQKGSIFLLVPSVSVAVIPEKKKKSENAERGKSCPTLCVYSYKGEVSEEGVRRVEFSVSLSLFLHFPLLLRLCLLAPIVFPCDRCSEALFLLKHLKWFSTNKGQTYWKLFLALSLHAIFKLKKKKAKQSCSLFFAHTLICLSALLTHHHQPTFHLI